MSDLIRAISMSLGAKNVSRFYDIIHPAPVDYRNPREIVAEIVEKAGLRMVKKENGTDGNGHHGHDGD